MRFRDLGFFRYLVVAIGDGDFEFTDVIFTIFWMCFAWRPRISRCLLVGDVRRGSVVGREDS